MSGSYPDIEKTVQAYVLNKLSDQEAEDFEAYFLGDADIVEMVETAQRMHIGLKSSDTRSQARSNETHSKNGFLGILFEMISVPVPAYVMAASLMIAIVVLPIFYNSGGGAQPELQLARFSSEATRSGSKKVMIDFSNQTSTIGIFVKVAQVDYRDYRLRLRGTNDDIWQSEPFQMSALKDALVLVPQGVVNGSQIVEVIGISQEGHETEVEFCNYNERCR